MNDYLIALTTFTPAAFALLMLLVPNAELAKKVGLLGSFVALFFASWLAYDYGWKKDGHPTAEVVFTTKVQAIAEQAAKDGRTEDARRILADLDAVKRGGKLAAPADVYEREPEAKELILAASVPQAKVLRHVEYHPWIKGFRINYFMAADGLSIPLVFLTGVLIPLCLVYSLTVDKLPRAFYALFLLLETGMIGVFCAMDMFLFYVFWEIVLLPMYFLIGIWGGPRRIYAAIKFFIYTLVGSVLMLIAFLYMYFHADPDSFNALTLMAVVPGLPYEIAKWLFIAMFIAFAIKVPVFPFHTWLPDAHVEAPTAASMVLAGILLKMGGYGFFRFMYPLCPDVAMSKTFLWLIAILGLINMVYGALVAMAQTDFKSLVAYSSISHMGYVLLGLAALTPAGVTGGVLQMFNHGISSPMMFAIVGVIYDRAHHRNLNEFGGIGLVMPYYTGLATVGFFAGLGLPGLNGFISEALTFLGAYQKTSFIRDGLDGRGLDATWIVFVALLAIVFTAAYVLWTVQRVYLGPVKEKYMQFPDMNAREAITLIPLGIGCILFGVWPALILDYMNPSIEAIIQQVTGAR